jgi:phosphoserine phosphatase RsbU/P
MYFDKHILIVDDSFTIRQGLNKTLREKGYLNVDIAENGLDASLKISEKNYDMVITDYDMPEMNGGELVRYIKQNHPEILVIVLSAQAERKIIVELMRLAENYIVKDNIMESKENLFYIIEQTFNNNKLKKENEKLFNELTKRDKKTQLELKIAKKLLSEVLTKKISKPAKFKIKLYNCYSDIIGGDFYYFKRLNNDKAAILLCDVCGHGIPAALFLFLLKTAIDKAVEGQTATDMILKRLNAILFESLPGTIFAEISCVILDDSDSTITYSNAFQNPILYLKSDGTVEEITDENIKFIGVFSDDETFYKESIQMSPGERIFLLTDGITEAGESKEDILGVEGVKKVIKLSAEIPLEKSIIQIYKAALKFSKNKINDDVTIIGIEAE